jgi:hypothetical protein
MRTPNASELLDAWDAGSRMSGTQRALLLARLIHPERAERLAGMPLGWITLQVLKLRAELLGPTVVCLANCRQCGAVVESQLETGQLSSLATDAEPADFTPQVFPLRQDDYCVEFRLPTCADLLALHGSPQSAARRLAVGLVEHASQGEREVAAADLPAEIQTALEHAVLECDPLAHIELGLSCPTCGCCWTEPLHVIDFVWTEISAVAQRLLNEVARLAYAFGWHEADILAMSEVRRQRYLELLPS